MTMRGMALRRVLTSLLVVFASICVVLVLFMTVFRWVDQSVCVSLAASRLGIPATYSGIENYIFGNATPGMTREETLEVLSKIGKSRLIFSSYDPSSTRTQDTISTRFCLHPLNNLIVFAVFDLHGRLVSIAFPISD